MSYSFPSSYSVRRFVTADRQALIKAIDAVCAEGHWMETLRYEPTPAWEHALRNPQCPRHLLFVVGVGDQIVGWCRLFRLPNCQDNNPTGELGIGLLPAYRERGLGTALVLYACWEAPRLGLDTVVLSVQAHNQRAIHVFKRCGFVEQSEEKCGIITMVR